MVIKIKYSYFIILLASLSLIYSCKQDEVDLPEVEDCTSYMYEDCNTVEPIDGIVRFFFSINQHNNYVIFDVYQGNVDDGNLYFRDTSWNSSLEYILPVEQYYSVKATYIVDGNSLKVVDGGKIRTYSSVVCDSTCWGMNKLELDLSIKQ